MNKEKKLELLAPAGNFDCLKSALSAGADAVYLGLKTLNARKGAGNFSAEELKEACRYARSEGAKTYLTLNTHVSFRETGQAARALELAAEAGVDAVLVTDPMFFELAGSFPELDFHFSTQAGIENSKGVEFARRAGIKRAVLARELSEEEITAASKPDSVETEVFVQGAMCFCVSGKCLLSSWAGGRSGNRGTCTSPCRVLWKDSSGAELQRLSMHDLSLIERLEKIRKAGVSCIKIEGRLKKPEWVYKTVQVFRRALDGETEGEIHNELSDYTGRKQAAGYFDGQTKGLCGEGGRIPSESSIDIEDECKQNAESGKEFFTVAVSTANGKFEAEVKISEEEKEQIRLPLTAVKKAKRGVNAENIAYLLATQNYQNAEFAGIEFDEPERLYSKKTANSLAEELSRIFHQRQKKAHDYTIRIHLREQAKDTIKAFGRIKENKFPLTRTAKVNSLRADYPCAKQVAGSLYSFEQVVVENVELGKISSLRKNWIAAMPHVFYEDRIEYFKTLAEKAKTNGITLEVNSWAGLEIALEAGAEFTAGPGLMILNHTAAMALKNIGAKEAFISIEADKRKIRELSQASPLPLSLTVSGFPCLGITRAEIDEKALKGQTLEDERGIRLRLEPSSENTILRSQDPYSILGCEDRGIMVRRFSADLAGIKDPAKLKDAVNRLRRGLPFTEKKAYKFNFQRNLA
ncbi:putative protease YhbU precursor [Sedimentisphaera cyanobacteriorum]|uniref:Putative protease YhbU n=1 Tax=Sedimentisphaera cyanobacteriorum TaxID=1940790 RepID=A0A1Q2HM45_9BACT|nr:peptidase U32 family protein [Sedimentisphaera cyanobacteriorum]AQQ08324.1 putative protease YhbU precursor [Sedimentisphaera cyanobacteriorum]